MIQAKKKICKGNGHDTHGHGCEMYHYMFKFNLCKSCFIKWLSTEKGKEYMKKTLDRSKVKVMAGIKKEKAAKKKALKKETPKDKIYNSRAWYYCSKYVLLYYADSDGIVKCSTSGRSYQLPTKNIQCGHYLKATEHAGTAFNFKNLAPQSLADNVYNGGKPEIMKDWLINEHGEDVIEYLNNEKNKAYKLDAMELELIKQYYKSKFEALVKEKGFNPWSK